MWEGFHTFLQPWGQLSVALNVLLQARRQVPATFRESWGQIAVSVAKVVTDDTPVTVSKHPTTIAVLLVVRKGCVSPFTGFTAGRRGCRASGGGKLKPSF